MKVLPLVALWENVWKFQNINESISHFAFWDVCLNIQHMLKQHVYKSSILGAQWSFRHNELNI